MQESRHSGALHRTELNDSCIWCIQGYTKRCRLSWLTNSALCIWAQKRGEGGRLYTEAYINFGDLAPYLTYGCIYHSIEFTFYTTALQIKKNIAIAIHSIRFLYIFFLVVMLLVPESTLFFAFNFLYQEIACIISLIC